MLVTLTLALLAGVPVASAEQHDIEAKLARSARELAPGSLEALEQPVYPPYHFVIFKDAQTGERSAAAVAPAHGDFAADVVLGNDLTGMGRVFTNSHFFNDHGAAEALEVWAILRQVGSVLRESDLAALPEDERKVAFAPRLEKADGSRKVTGFVRQGEQVYRVALQMTHQRDSEDRVEVQVVTIGELLGRDELGEAVRALQSKDEVLRATAAFELGSATDSRAVDALLTALKDSSPEVRSAAAESLGRQGARDAALVKRIAPALEKAKALEKSEGARKAMQDALTAMPSAKASAKKQH